MKNLSDEELIPLLKNREEMAVNYVYQANWPMVLHYIKDNSGNEEDAKDLYQEGFLDFLEKVWREDFQLTGKIKGFIYSICRRKWLYFLRGKKEVTSIEYTDTDDNDNENTGMINEPFEEVNEEPAGLPDDEQIKNAVLALGEPCRSLLTGFYYERLSMEQLMVKMNYKNANVAKQQKFRCMDRLKKMLF